MRTLREEGFTIVELISVMVVTLILSGIIFTFVFDYWGGSANLQAKLETFATRLNANDRLREALSASSGLVIQNSIPDDHVSNPDPAIGSGQYWVPLHAVPGNYVVGNSGTTTPLVYFRRPAINTAHAIVMNGSQPYENEYVLYLNGSTKQMLLRTLANPAVSGNSVVTSCPLAQASPSCPPDKLIAADITSIDLRYFSRSGNLIDWTSLYDPVINSYAGPDFTAVEAIELNLHITKQAAFHGVNNSTNQTVVRIALLNI